MNPDYVNAPFELSALLWVPMPQTIRRWSRKRRRKWVRQQMRKGLRHVIGRPPGGFWFKEELRICTLDDHMLDKFVLPILYRRVVIPVENKIYTPIPFHQGEWHGESDFC